MKLPSWFKRVPSSGAKPARASGRLERPRCGSTGRRAIGPAVVLDTAVRSAPGRDRAERRPYTGFAGKDKERTETDDGRQRTADTSVLPFIFRPSSVVRPPAP